MVGRRRYVLAVNRTVFVAEGSREGDDGARFRDVASGVHFNHHAQSYALSNRRGGHGGIMRETGGWMTWIALSFAALLLAGCDESGKVQDEAMRAGRPPESFPAAGGDYFKAMDNGASFTPDEVKGRNMWIVWTGGNDRFWDVTTNDSGGAFDLLKIVSSSPGLKFSRDNRWEYLGLVNEPCFSKPTG